MQLVEKRNNACFNLVGLPLADRPAWFLALLPNLLALRATTGHPHWIVIDEAHHLLPAEAQPAPASLPEQLVNTIQVSVHPDLIARSALGSVDALLVVGNEPVENLQRFARATGRTITGPADRSELDTGEALAWLRDSGSEAVRIRTIPSHVEHRRHHRKYATGELPEDRSFYFRGPHGALNLRAQNLIVFLQMADGVDDETWTFHLRRGDYSRWMEQGIKDEALTSAVRRIETSDIDPQEARRQMHKVIEELYTLPAG
jgi:hypothetical protein